MAEASGLWFQPGGLAEASGAFLAGSRGRQVQGAGEWTGGGGCGEAGRSVVWAVKAHQASVVT